MIRDLKQAIRSLAHWRLGALASIVTLAIGIAATTSLAALVQLLLAFVEYPGIPEPERVARIYASNASFGVERGQVALPEFETTLAQAKSFDMMGAYLSAEATLGASPDATSADAAHVTPGFFRTMGVTPAAGRVFTDADRAAGDPVVILSEPLWRRLFPAGQVGQVSLKVDGVDHTVIGVLPRQFKYSFIGIGADVWLPLAQTAAARPAVVTVLARLRQGVSWGAAGAELESLGRVKAPWTWRAIPIQADSRTRVVGAVAFTLGPAAIVLVIACMNIACMLMARGIGREKELAVRRALGASRPRIVSLLLLESVVLAGISGVLGTAMAAAVLRVVAAQIGAAQPDLAGRLATGFQLLPLALTSTTLACVLFGTVPALRLSRCHVAAALNGVPSSRRIHVAGYGARDLIVFFELGTAVGLIVFGAMLFKLFGDIQRVKPLFPADRIIALTVPGESAAGVRERVSRVAGVVGVALLAEHGRSSLAAEGRPASVMSNVSVDGAFFKTLGLPIVRGRDFDATEKATSGVVIVSERAARMLQPDGDPIGLHVQITGRRAEKAVVIGVCRDRLDYGALARAGFVPAEYYTPYDAAAAGDTIVLAGTAADAHGLIRTVGAAAQPPSGGRPIRAEVFADTLANRESGGGMVVVNFLGALAVLALLLAASGVFAVISQSVAQRTREFGIRLAMGAAPGHVLGMVLARETKLIGAAIGTGAAFTLGLTFVGFRELVRLSATAPGLWFSVAGLCGGVAAVACALATYRIIRLEPAVVLRRH